MNESDWINSIEISDEIKSWKFEMSSMHIACLCIFLSSTRDDNLVEETLNEVDDYEFYIINSIFLKKKKRKNKSQSFFFEKNFNQWWFIKSKYDL